MKHNISFPRSSGLAARQAHVALPKGTYEREMGKEGFFGPATHFYHAHPPTGWVDWEGPLRPRAFDLNRISAIQASPWDATTILHNASVQMRFWRAPVKMDHLVRNGDGDDLLFIHQGAGDLFCDFGHLSFETGDYLLLPRGTMWRIETTSPVTALMIEATNGTYKLPDKGVLGPHAIFDPAVLDTPLINEHFENQKTQTGPDGVWQVRIKRRNVISTVSYPYNPLDIVGWKGDLAAVRLNLRDIRPVMSHRYHVPPSVHSTFVADRFVVCTFTPRPFESDPEALKVPFYHNNDDFDEVLFYHAGDFFSRDNIEAGMVTFHPCGFTHGPHPKALEAAFTPRKPATDEYAVMVDTRDPLDIGAIPDGVEWDGYVDSWRVKENTE